MSKSEAEILDFGGAMGKAGVTAKLNSPIVKEWLNKRRQSIQPWSDFINTNKFQKPISVSQWTKRTVKNIEHFQSNYIFVFTGLIIYCIISSPLLLIAIGVFLAACYVINARNEHSKVKILGKELSYAQQYAIAACLSFPLFFLAGAGTAVFWVLGVSFFLIMIHASFHIAPEEGATEEDVPFMETV